MALKDNPMTLNVTSSVKISSEILKGFESGWSLTANSAEEGDDMGRAAASATIVIPDNITSVTMTLHSGDKILGERVLSNIRDSYMTDSDGNKHYLYKYYVYVYNDPMSVYGIAKLYPIFRGYGDESEYSSGLAPSALETMGEYNYITLTLTY